jgi:signal transduction histidine kinase
MTQTTLSYVTSPLQTTVQILTTVIDAIPSSCALLDAQGSIVAVNRSWRQFAHENGLQSPDCGLGGNYLKTCAKAVEHGGDSYARQALGGLCAVLAGDMDTYEMEYPCHSATEKRWFLLRGVALNGVPGAKCLVMHVDITQRVLSELQTQAKYGELKELVESRRQYEQSLEHMYSMVSHDIRAPLCSLIAALKFLEQSLPGVSDTDRQLVSMAQFSADQILHLVNDFLDHSKLTQNENSLEMTRVSCAQIFPVIEHIMSPLAEAAGVNLSIEFCDAEIECNLAAIIRIIVNLASNAIKFTPAGRTVYINAAEGEDTVLFQVRDEGKGMEPDQVERLFVPFAVSASSAVMPGSGLGLSIVKLLLEQHGSSAKVVSEPDVGTAVSFGLRKAEREEASDIN